MVMFVSCLLSQYSIVPALSGMSNRSHNASRLKFVRSLQCDHSRNDIDCSCLLLMLCFHLSRNCFVGNHVSSKLSSLDQASQPLSSSASQCRSYAEAASLVSPNLAVVVSFKPASFVQTVWRHRMWGLVSASPATQPYSRSSIQFILFTLVASSRSQPSRVIQHSSHLRHYTVRSSCVHSTTVSSHAF